MLLDYFNYPQSWLTFQSHSDPILKHQCDPNEGGEAPTQTRGRGQTKAVKEDRSRVSLHYPDPDRLLFTSLKCLLTGDRDADETGDVDNRHTLKVWWLVFLDWCKMAEFSLTQPSKLFAFFFWQIRPRPFCVPTTTSDLIWKDLSSRSSSSPASSSSTHSHSSSSSSFLLFTTSTHAQLLSTLVLSESVLFARVYVCVLLHFHTFLTGIFCLFVLGFFFFFSLLCSTGFVVWWPQVLPWADEIPPYSGSLAEGNQVNLLIILLKEVTHNCFDLVQQKPEYMRFKHKYNQAVGVLL